jgi:hypothetical protein
MGKEDAIHKLTIIYKKGEREEIKEIFTDSLHKTYQQLCMDKENL